MNKNLIILLALFGHKCFGLDITMPPPTEIMLGQEWKYGIKLSSKEVASDMYFSLDKSKRDTR